MKLIREKQHVLRLCLVGGQQWFDETVFEVEPSDVGRDKDNHNGYQHATYRFRLLDVGRHIKVSGTRSQIHLLVVYCEGGCTMKSQDPPEYVVSTDDAIIKQALTILEGRLRAPGIQLTSPSASRDFLTLKLAELPHEVFVCLWLDGQNRLIEYSELFRGH